MRILTSTDGGTNIVDTLLPHEGGTGQTTAPAALVALNAVPLTAINVVNGVVGLDENGDIALSRFPVNNISVISLEGPISILRGTTVTYRINNFDSFTNYVFTNVFGNVNRVEDIITYTAPNSPMNGGFNLNGRQYVIPITDWAVEKPSLTSPVNASTVYATNYNLTASSFVASGGIAHTATDWQISTVSDFSSFFINIVADTASLLNLMANSMVRGTTYYTRVRYKASNGSYSPWSDARSFTISTAYLFDYVVAANAMNLNIKTLAIAAGWNQVTPIIGSVTINNGVAVGSANATTPAIDTDFDYPSGSQLTLINNGTIAGKGGNGGNGGIGNFSVSVSGTPGTAGGPALKVQTALSVTNNGIIGGGGGGGGGSAGTRNWWSGNGQFNPHGGGGGGGGQGYTAGAGGSGASGTMSNGAAGSAGSLTAPGTGNQPNVFYGGTGGTLGNPGAPGQHSAGEIIDAGVSAGIGGAAGPSVIGNTFITWLSNGTRLGALT